MTTHATTKYRWSYRLDDGEKLTGAFILPIGEEHLAENWFQQIIEKHLKLNEKFERSKGTLIDYGNNEKLR